MFIAVLFTKKKKRGELTVKELELSEAIHYPFNIYTVDYSVTIKSVAYNDMFWYGRMFNLRPEAGI